MKKNRRLKRIIIIFLVLLVNLIYTSLFYKVNAENETDDMTQEILKSQSDSIGITSFIEEANKYKNEDFDIDINQLIKSAIKGNIDNKTLSEKILSILFGQVQEAITSIRKHNGNNCNIKCA